MAQTQSHRRRTLILIAVPLVLVGLYLGVMAAVRAYVDRRIAASVGQELPPFSVRDRDEREWSPQALRGKKVVLHFFRSRCPSCFGNRDTVNQLHRELRDDEILLGVMTDQAMGFPEAESAATLERYGHVHPVLMADAAFMDAFHGVSWSKVTPVVYVVDSKGQIRQSFRGPQDLETLRDALRRLP